MGIDHRPARRDAPFSRSTPSAMSASELSDPDRFPKKGRDYSGRLDDVDEKLQIATADLVAGSMGG